MKKQQFILIIGVIIALFSVNVFAEGELNKGYITFKDSSGRVITRTGHMAVNGDEFLNNENKLYRVSKVNGNTAIVKLVKKDGLKIGALERVQSYLAGLFNFDFLRAEVKQNGPIAIYHTHTDESYVPTDGTSSKEAKGGIFQVGDIFAKTLEKEGVPVAHSKTPHDPHDSMAYDRSRRTAAQLLRQRPTTLVDIHRDAGPSSTYSTKINNEWVTQCQLVVGRQNPNFQANNSFAKKIKTAVDKKYPGLIKGIFYGKGKFNQDLGPRAILLEFGTEENSKQAAERGAKFFATAARDVLYASSGARTVNRGSMRSLFWILAIVIGGVGLFFLMNRKGLKGLGKEFTGAVGEADPAMQKKDEENQTEHNGESS